jgi:poly(A) polymerase
LRHLPQAVDFGLAMAAMWAGFETQPALAECEKLKLSGSRLKEVRFLLEHRSVLLDARMPVSRLKLLMHQPYFQDLLTLEEAIQTASGQSVEAVKTIHRRALEIAPEEVHPRPLLDGNEMIALGAVPGPTVGHLAQEMYIAQLEGRIKSSDQARQWVTRWLESQAAAEE